MKLEVQSGNVPGIEQAVARVTIHTELRPTTFQHFILVLDCSGSMTGYLDSVKVDSKRFVESLSDDNYASVIIFSGHNRAKLIAGPTKIDNSGRTLINRAIDHEVKILDTTVFSEALERTLEAAQRLSADDITQAAILFTDGCAVPTQWNVITEQNKAYQIAAQLRNAGVILHSVGYGVYYDRQFIDALMRSGGGSGIYHHIDEIDDFAGAVAEIEKITRQIVSVNCVFRLLAEGAEVGRIFRTQPELAQVGHQEASFFGLDNGTATLYVELDRPVDSLTIDGQLGNKAVNQTAKVEALDDQGVADFIRLLAGFHFLQGNTATATELFELVGEDGLAEMTANAYSEREQRRHGNSFRQMFRHASFIGAGLKAQGPNHNILNILRILIEDSTNTIYLPPGSYKRSGLKTVDRSVVQNPLGGMAQVVGYSSHEDRFNFSIRCLKEVEVIEKGQRVRRKIWRSYNIILDGNLHTPRLLAIISEDSFKQLQEAGAIATDVTYDMTQSYLIDLSDVKLISPNWARPGTLGLVNLMKEIEELKAEQWALNQLFSESAKELDDPDIYRTKEKVVENVPTETYQAACVRYSLLKHKTQKSKEQYKAEWERRMAEENFGDTGARRLKAVRHRLIVIRYLSRAVVFAMERVGSQVIPWSQAVQNRHDKMEQEAQFDGATLKRTAWTEECACS